MLTGSNQALQIRISTTVMKRSGQGIHLLLFWGGRGQTDQLMQDHVLKLEWHSLFYLTSLWNKIIILSWNMLHQMPLSIDNITGNKARNILNNTNLEFRISRGQNCLFFKFLKLSEWTNLNIEVGGRKCYRAREFFKPNEVARANILSENQPLAVRKW